MSEERQHSQEPAEGADEAVEAHGAERAAEKEEVSTGGEARTAEHPREPAEGPEEDVGAPGAGRTDEQPTGEGTHESLRDERTEKEVEKKPIAEDAGLVEDEEEYDWEATAQGVRQQPTIRRSINKKTPITTKGRKKRIKAFWTR